MTTRDRPDTGRTTHHPRASGLDSQVGRTGQHLAAVAVLAAVAITYTWPLLSRLTVAIPGGPTDLDVATMVWNVGWVSHALAAGGPLLRTDDVLVPFGADLRLHTYGLFPGLLVSPLVPLAGVVGAFNLMLIGTLVLNGVVCYALLYQETSSAPASLVAATCFMLATPLLDQLTVGRPTFASLWLVAASLLVMRALLRRPHLWHGVALAALLLGAMFTDFQIALYAALWLAMYAVWRLRWQHAPSLALGAWLSAVVFGVVLYPALRSDDVPRPALADMQEYSFRVWDFVDPTVLQHAYGLELGVTAVAAIVIWRRPSVWLLGALVCEVLALGPYLQPTEVPLPFAALSLWPPLGQFRTPYRLAMPAVLGLAVVLGMVLARWRVSNRMWVALALVAARTAVALLLDPLPTQSYPSYALYQRLAAEPDRFTLLEVPFGVRSGLERIGNGGEVLEFYQHVHGKPLLNGMIARLPSSVFTEYRAHPALLLLSGEPIDATAEDLRAVLAWTDARYIVVHRAMLTADQRQRIEALVTQIADLEEIESDLAVYRVKV